MDCHGGIVSSGLRTVKKEKLSRKVNHACISKQYSYFQLYYYESLLYSSENGTVKGRQGSLTRHMGKYVPIHCLQAVPTEGQLRKLGHVPEHIRWQVLQRIVPQVKFLVQYSAHLVLWNLVDQCTVRILCAMQPW